MFGTGAGQQHSTAKPSVFESQVAAQEGEAQHAVAGAQQCRCCLSLTSPIGDAAVVLRVCH